LNDSRIGYDGAAPHGRADHQARADQHKVFDNVLTFQRARCQFLGRAEAGKELQDPEPEKDNVEADPQKHIAIPSQPVCYTDIDTVKQRK
jgi:hypothetical protein